MFYTLWIRNLRNTPNSNHFSVVGNFNLLKHTQIEGNWCRKEHRWGTLNFKFLSDLTKWPLMFDYISLSKQSCSPSVRKLPRIGIKKLSPWASRVSSQHIVPKIFLVHKTQAVLSLSDILCISCPAGFLLAYMCFHVWLLSSLCACVCVCVIVQIYTQTFLETRSSKLVSGGGWAFIHLVTLRAMPVWLGFLIKKLKSSYLGLIGAPGTDVPLSSILQT